MFIGFFDFCQELMSGYKIWLIFTVILCMILLKFGYAFMLEIHNVYWLDVKNISRHSDHGCDRYCYGNCCVYGLFGKCRIWQSSSVEGSLYIKLNRKIEFSWKIFTLFKLLTVLCPKQTLLIVAVYGKINP